MTAIDWDAVCARCGEKLVQHGDDQGLSYCRKFPTKFFQPLPSTRAAALRVLNAAKLAGGRRPLPEGGYWFRTNEGAAAVAFDTLAAAFADGTLDISVFTGGT